MDKSNESSSLFDYRIRQLQHGKEIADKFCDYDTTKFYVIANRHLGDMARVMKQINQIKLYYGQDASRYHFNSDDLNSNAAKKHGCASAFPKRKLIRELFVITNRSGAGVARLYDGYIDGVIILEQADLDDLELYAYSGCGIHQNIIADEGAGTRLCGRWKIDEGDWVRGVMFGISRRAWELVIPKELPVCSMQISEKTNKSTKDLIKAIHFDVGSSVILCPIARGSSMADKEIWEKLTQKLVNRGYKCYTNAAKSEDVIKGTHSLFVDVDVIVCLAKMGCHVIGVQCGLMDIFVWNGCPHITVLSVAKTPVDVQYMHNRNCEGEITIKKDATYLRIANQDTAYIVDLILSNMR